MTKNYLELIDIEDIEFTNEYDNMVDIQIDIDESFCLSNGIISHNSAQSTCLTGFSVVGRKYYGAFPLKGKPLNVRGEGLNKIKDNEEIKNIISALGLEFGKKYINTDDLRYGKLVLMTDADCDGHHIKGLIINIFECYWPELLNIDFIYEFITPIIKVENKEKFKYFYKLDDYKKWKLTSYNKNWFIKYYKGLGTIEPEESKLFFNDINKHLIKFNTSDYKVERDLIDLVFNKKRADDRKVWLLNHKTNFNNDIIDKFKIKQTYNNFINNELIEFSISDNLRSIPNIMDGLKPSQRKILYTLFNKGNNNQIKVSSLAGAVLEKTSYHHGQVSLEGSIVSLAQNFIGSNNFNLLEPKGQFGTRIKGGKDASASRYIFTNLNPLTRDIFIKEDDNILNYLNDDGLLIEPDFYIPIIPMILVNGSDGIGTGWKSDVPKYKIENITEYCINKLTYSKKNIELLPSFKGFKGTIEWDDNNNRYIVKGVVKKLNSSKIIISELPIGVWYDKYYDFLDKLIEDKKIKSYTKDSTDINVNIEIIVNRSDMDDIMENPIDFFNLYNFLNMNNMYIYNEEYKLLKFENPYEIIDYFFNIRLEYYNKRKDFIIDKINKDLLIINNKIKFINDIINNKIIIQEKSKNDIIENLNKLNFDKVENNYDYLLSMPLYSLTMEKINDLNDTLINKNKELSIIINSDIKKIWLNDLKNLKKLL